MARLAYETPFGIGWILYEGARVGEILLPSGGRASARSDPRPPVQISRLARALEAFFAGTACFVPGSSLTDGAGSTPLLRAIYRSVAALRPGETMTYAEVAEAVGRPGAARVVGMAMARNPLPPVIPCHRVVGSDGRLRGYGGGLEMKARLLEMESAHAG